MQFIGAKGITLFVAIVLIACGVGFGSGWLVGRQYPAHSFQRFGDTHYLLDPVAGKVCDPFKNPNANVVDQALTDSLNKTWGVPSHSSSGGLDFTDLTGKNLDYPPACGK
jgi:hypothetical protein